MTSNSNVDVMVPGQRWLSEAETELGLGCVRQVDFRLVTVDFPVAGESRTYAKREAPLVRLRLEVGDEVEDRQGERREITAVLEHGGLLFYDTQNSQGEKRTLAESDLSDQQSFNSPRDRLLAGRLDSNEWFELRYATWLRREEQLRSGLYGLVGPRISLIPHQLHIAAEVSARYQPRILLADEVGLGKTVEAGLILHRMLLTGRVKRVLLLVPEALLHQWLVEMLRRFNLRFSLFDEERFSSYSGENPFHNEQRILCSLEFLLSRSEVARSVLEGDWDFLVVDEAHHLAWDEESASLEYELVEALSAQVKAVLLLTATPEQLGQSGHFGRLRLLDSDRFHDYSAFMQEEERYAPVAQLSAKLLDGEELSVQDQSLLVELLGPDLPKETQQQVDQLVDRHGTGRALFRNTRAAVKGFPARRLHHYPLPVPEEYLSIPCGVQGWQPELAMSEGWTENDPRVTWLVDKIRQLSPEKVLLICSHPQVVLALREKLQGREGILAAVFHEGMGIVERDRAAAYFADPAGARLLICSEIGSEGRNFQFAHHLVLFDLPLEPDLLEQRIGRLDRIGQCEEIQLHVPYFLGTPSEFLFRWYRDALRIFNAPSPAAGNVYQQLLNQVHAALNGQGDMEPLIRQGAELLHRLNRSLAAGRDRLLELQSHHPEQAAVLVDEIQSQEGGSDLRAYLYRYWDAYGVHHEPGPGCSVVLQPGAHMLHEHFPGLASEGNTVTFDRQDALVHEDREYLTWEHPMVLGAMDGLTSVELGSAAVVLMHSAKVQPGTLLLEMIHVAEAMAPAELEITRYLPPTVVRSLLDVNGRDLSHKIAASQIRGDCLSRQQKLAGTIIRSQSALLRELIAKALPLAQQKTDLLVRESTAKMEAELKDELERLQALSRVNPNVRSDEMEFLQLKQRLLHRHLVQTRVRLDAVRLLVFTTP